MNEDLDTLLNDISKDPKGLKMRFTTKVFKCLAYVQNHNGDAERIGLCWFNDGVNFLCNTGTLSSFLKLKRNSINSNFRSHDFAHKQVDARVIRQDFPFISDIREWRCCYHMKNLFRRDCTLAQINQIPCHPLNISYLSPTQEAVCSSVKANVDDVQKLNFVQMLNSTWPDQFSILQTQICNVWNQLKGESEIDKAVLVRAIFYNTLTKNRNVEKAINFLLMDESISSQNSDKFVSFTQYAKFYLRYGGLEKSALTIEQLTDSSGDGEGLDIFVNWFKPGVSAAYANHYLEKLGEDRFIVRPSNSGVNRFSIHKQKFVSSIIFDCCEGCFIIETPSQRLKSDSLPDLLFNILKLTPPVVETPRYDSSGLSRFFSSQEDSLFPSGLNSQGDF